MVYCLKNSAQSSTGKEWDRQACAVTNSTEVENKILLSHQLCGILGFWSVQEGRVREKVWQTLVTWWFDLINPLKSTNCCSFKDTRVSVLKAHVSSRAPVVQKGRRIFNFLGRAVLKNEYYVLAE